MDVRVPEMIIKLKQGIGRLIRNFSDTGIVSIIDSLSGTPSRSDTTILLGTRCLSIAAPLISKRSKPFIIRYAIEAGLQSFVFAPNERKNSAGDLFGPPRYSYLRLWYLHIQRRQNIFFQQTASDQR